METIESLKQKGVDVDKLTLAALNPWTKRIDRCNQKGCQGFNCKICNALIQVGEVGRKEYRFISDEVPPSPVNVVSEPEKND